MASRQIFKKVASAFRLAKADLAQGETQNARARLEMVAKQGGTLYIAEEAKIYRVEGVK